MGTRQKSATACMARRGREGRSGGEEGEVGRGAARVAVAGGASCWLCGSCWRDCTATRAGWWEQGARDDANLRRAGSFLSTTSPHSASARASASYACLTQPIAPRPAPEQAHPPHPSPTRPAASSPRGSLLDQPRDLDLARPAARTGEHAQQARLSVDTDPPAPRALDEDPARRHHPTSHRRLRHEPPSSSQPLGFELDRTLVSSSHSSRPASPALLGLWAHPRRQPPLLVRPVHLGAPHHLGRQPRPAPPRLQGQAQGERPHGRRRLARRHPGRRRR